MSFFSKIIEFIKSIFEKNTKPNDPTPTTPTPTTTTPKPVSDTKPLWNECVGAPTELEVGARYTIFKDGSGLCWRFRYNSTGGTKYKPVEYHNCKPDSNSRLWAVNLVPSQISWAGEVENWDIPHGKILKHFDRPNGIGAASGKPFDGTKYNIDDSIANHYTSGGMKFRDAKATRRNAVFVAYGFDGHIKARERIYHPDVRQE